MKKTNKVYVLVDPTNLKIRYIGITCRPLKERLSQHISDTKIGKELNTHKSNWIKSLIKINSKPYIRLLTFCSSREESSSIEKELIIRYKTKHNLTNEIVDEGRFSNTTNKNAKVILSKQVYVYTYEGIYLKSYSSRMDAAKELNVTYNSLKMCLSGKIKYSKQYQFSATKVDKLNDLSENCKYGAYEFFVKDNHTGEHIRCKGVKDCLDRFKMTASKGRPIKKLSPIFKKYYGDRYTLLY